MHRARAGAAVPERAGTGSRGAEEPDVASAVASREGMSAGVLQVCSVAQTRAIPPPISRLYLAVILSRAPAL